LGAVNLPHSAGIGIAVAKDPSKWSRGGRDNRNELDGYVETDDAKAKELIQILVEHKVALVPTFMIISRVIRRAGLNPGLRAGNYLPIHTCGPTIPRVRSNVLWRVRIDQGALRERRMKGYQNAMRFHKMFVDAGDTWWSQVTPTITGSLDSICIMRCKSWRKLESARCTLFKDPDDQETEHIRYRGSRKAGRCHHRERRPVAEHPKPG
jgi:hypothetical protein